MGITIKRFLTGLALVISAILAKAQGQGDVWFFGDGVILDFTQGAPLVNFTAMTSKEGSSSLSTTEGKLLIYTNGWELFDSTHATFQNWVAPDNGYFVNQQFVQGNLLLEINDSIVFLFGVSGSPTSGSHLAQYYARINLNANAGSGRVESSQNMIGDSLTEHFAAIRDATNEGWWILSHKTATDIFVKWHIDRSGAITKSFQQVGGVHPPLWVYYIGQLVFSPQGDRMAVASDRGRLEYYSFDRCTGNLTLLNSIQKPAVDSNGFFGVSFSPSGKLLYGSDGYFGPIGQTDGVESKLYQYEIDSLDILSTEKVIWRTPDCDSCRRAIGHHRLGPDGKIYVIQGRDDFHFEIQDTLMVIHSPDSIGSACDFRPHGVFVWPGKTQAGLPNIPDYRLPPVVAQVAACGPDILLCPGDSVRLGVPDTSGTLTFQWWPAAGLSDPNAAQPWASPATSTTYYLVITDTTVQSSCDNTIDSVRVKLVTPWLSMPVAQAGGDTLVCAGTPLQLGVEDTSGGAWAYAWSPASGVDDPSASNPNATLSASQEFVLTAYRPEVTGSCRIDRDTVLVGVYDPSVLPQFPAGPDAVICVGDTVQLGAAPTAFQYDWTGSNLSDVKSPQPLAWPEATGWAAVQVTDTSVSGPCGVVSDTVQLLVEQPFTHAPPPALVQLCPGGCAVVGVPPVAGMTYAWSPAAGLDDATVSMTLARPSATTNYVLTVTDTVLSSAGCRELRFEVVAEVEACARQTMLQAGVGVLDLGPHDGVTELTVWDMQGRLVWFDGDYGNGWKAGGFARGVYVYKVRRSGFESLSLREDCGAEWVSKLVVW